MMYTYVPKLHHAMIAAAIMLLLIAGGAYTDKARILKALNVGAWLFFFIWLVVLWMLAVNTWNEQTQKQIDWMIAFGKLDDEGRAAVAFAFPTIRYMMKRGEVRGMFENTSVPVEMFRTFLQTSNSKYISPRRDWYTADKPEWAWLEIQAWLEENNFILPDSAAGSHSWLWNGSAYNHLAVWWMAGRRLTEMDKVGMSLTTSSPPMEDAPSL